MDTLKDIPEFFESETGESIVARTDALGTFHELGPPDLCHIFKTNSKPGVKEIGSYHYVSGVDASSSASLAAYLNSLTYSMDDSQSWFTKSNAWRIRSGIYCCYNAFSRVDLRVEVKIPGGVESYYVDVRGERHEANATHWQETYLSAILRATLYSDDSFYRLAGYRKLDPITDVKAEQRFLEAAESLFWKGSQLGSKPEIQVATSVHNYLTDGLMKYFADGYRYQPAIDFFRRLHKLDPQVGALLAQVYINQNEEIQAIRVLHDDMKLSAMSFPLTHVQIDFLRSKGDYNRALQLAKYAVDRTPSEYLTWAKLTEVYMDLEDYKNALLTLNSCPMFTYNERDMHRMPPPCRTHLPMKPDIMNTGIMEEESPVKEAESDSNLSRLPAPALHGTFAKAYTLLTRLVFSLGWDQLLKYRSEVFVMEEEYRKRKTSEDEAIQLLDKAAVEESKISTKRLCERWLDNLFMVLYEDLRVYTFWRTEYTHYKAQNVPYRKTGTEWELLGDLALRLGHEDEAKIAYEHCLDHKFSAKAWMRLLSIYVAENNIQKALLAAVKLTVYHERWYHEIIYPTEMSRHMNTLIRNEGLSKIQNRLTSMNLPRPVQKLMNRYFKYAELFEVDGCGL
ncbi:Chs5p-Arf1p-binding proteins-domain-containing protein [Pilobolus umbonatus]|nr:Chs5p-Arf1p-binding proteins-domain-containing protein [Pilobolus umbonatus]